MEGKKKIKQNSLGKPSGPFFKNYPKLTEKRTFECLSELLTYSFDKDLINLDSWISVGKDKEVNQMVFVLVDQITGRELEDLLMAASNNFKEKVSNKNQFARLSNKSFGKKEEDRNFGIWTEILIKNKFYRNVSENQQNNQNEISDENSLPGKFFSKKEETTPLKISIEVENPKIKEPKSLYSEFLKHKLTPAELLENLFPTKEKNPDYLDTSGFPFIERNIVSLDCEMVETSKGTELARISLINEEFQTLFDSLVRPENPVTNYFTSITGLTAQFFDSEGTINLLQVIERLKKMIGPNTIIVGHSLENDLHALRLSHKFVVDTSLLFLKDSGFKHSLKNLAFNYFRAKIQQGVHDSIQDAQVAFALAKLKVEILAKLEPSMFSQRTDSGEFLKALCRRKKVMVNDFEFNLKNLLSAGIFIEKIETPIDVLDKLEKQLRLALNDQSFCSLVLGRFLLHKTHDFKEKFDRLVKFLEEAENKKNERSDRLLCVATVSYAQKHDSTSLFGYDVLFIY